MPCYKPLTGYKTSAGDVIFKERGDLVATLLLPCGRCIGCRLERSRQWAVRIMHERSLHDDAVFITLTYDEEHCPRDRSLDYSVFQRFMKRLRKKYGPVRFFMCGEYGELFDRPHYHAILFGIDFPDKTKIGKTLYESASLSALWPYGLSSIGEVTFESAAYVARYSLKKVTGDLAEDHYRVVDLETGEIFNRTPEFAHMSLKPGIGAKWLRKFSSDVYPRDYVVSRGTKAKPPRYYDKLSKKILAPDVREAMMMKRELDMSKRRADNTDSRLATREEVAKARASFYKREGIK